VDAIGARLEFFKVSIFELTNHERNSHELGGAFNCSGLQFAVYARIAPHRNDHRLASAQLGFRLSSPKAHPRRGII
jgi:hypothetical protein